jgi:phosphatidylserine decarboxylase
MRTVYSEVTASMSRAETFLWYCGNTTEQAFYEKCSTWSMPDSIDYIFWSPLVPALPPVRVLNRTTQQPFTEYINTGVGTGLSLIYNTDTGKGLLDTWALKTALKLATTSVGAQSVKTAPSYAREQICCMAISNRVDVESAEKKITEYASMNDFFTRRLRPGLRPVATDTREGYVAIVSPADCRMSIFPSVTKAMELWIKGRPFSIESLLQRTDLNPDFENAAVMVARLAPQDYHRFHFPLGGRVGETWAVEGTRYSV